MWSEGRHFCTYQIDKKRTTNDSGVMGNFDTTSNEARYCGMIEKILKVNFRTFHTYIFDCKWFEGVSKRHASGIMVDITRFHKGKNDTYVLPNNCEQVIFYSYGFLICLFFNVLS